MSDPNPDLGDFPKRIPKPVERKQRKALRSLEIKLVDPEMHGSTELFLHRINGVSERYRSSRSYQIVCKRSDSSGERVWLVVTAPASRFPGEVYPSIAVVKVTRSPTGELTTVVLDRPPPGTTMPKANEPEPERTDNPIKDVPELGYFMENFGCIIRGFLRRARPHEGERFSVMAKTFPRVREWASEFDESHPKQVKIRGSMVVDFESKMNCARNILDVRMHEERSSEVFDDRTFRSWFMGHAEEEQGELACWARARYLAELGDVQPKLATDLCRLRKEKLDE